MANYQGLNCIMGEITTMVASGVDIRTTQALMGHSDPKMTLKVYTKVEQTRLPAAMNQISSFLSDSKTVN